MGRKDYYATLGLSRGASLDAVRAAFRRLALEYHPERAGQEGAPRFREAVEAYEVLSDPVRRRRYDSEAMIINVSHTESVEPMFTSQAEAEPLIRRS